MEFKAPRKDRLVVAAVDFGTTYSGYAFSFRSEYDIDPLKIQTNQNWIAGAGLVSEKTASCVLLDPDRKLVEFGYSAEDKYNQLIEDADEADDDDKIYEKYYFFRQFKMLLHHSNEKTDDGLTRDTLIEDETGKSLPALLVISLSIGYMKDHMVSLINRRTLGVEENDIHWIITIPAIWDDSAKQFMREAAIECGIKSDQLTFALEPEAASIYCQLLKMEVSDNCQQQTTGGARRRDVRSSRSGTKYMILDLGGGTADITVHERQMDESLKEVHEPTGGPWGGTAVDWQFFRFLTDIVGEKTMKIFKRKEMADYLELCRDFEVKKRTIAHTTTGKVLLKIPLSFKETFEENSNGETLNTAIANTKYAEQVKWVGGKLKIEADIVKRFFDPPIRKIVSHVRELLDTVGRIDMILMVGGFSDCDLVEKAVRMNFPNHHILNPKEAVLAVLKGAVIFGHKPMAISSRVAKYTYGYESWPAFDPLVHPEDKKVQLHNRVCCRDVFHPYIRQGADVSAQGFITSVHSPVSQQQTDMAINVYISQNKYPKYVTDPDVRHIGTLLLPLPDAHADVSRKIQGRFHFGATELVVEAVGNDSGIVHKATFDCL